MLVPFPIAFFVGAFVTDLLFWRTGVAFWSAASFWLLSAGLVMAALAAVVGLIDVLSEPRIRMLHLRFVRVPAPQTGRPWGAGNRMLLRSRPGPTL
jgi:uncharacterized membrane protein